LQRLAKPFEQRLGNVHLDVREHPWHVERRLGAVGAEQELDHGVDKVAVEADQDAAVPGLGVEHGRDRFRLVAIEDVGEPAASDAAQREIRLRGRHRPQAFGAEIGHLVEDHMQHRHAFDRKSGGSEQLIRCLIRPPRLSFRH
jgi:hypothetical protein